MKSKTTLYFSHVVILGLFVCQAAFAAEPSLAKVQPYLEQSTLAVARVDLNKFDVNAAMDWAGKHLGARTVEQTQMVKGIAGSILTSLKTAGASDVYLSLAFEDLFQLGIVVYIPCNDIAAIESLVKSGIEKSPMLDRFRVYRADGTVIVAQEKTWSRVSAKSKEANKELLAQIQSIPTSSLSIALAIPEALREEVAQVWPENLPEVFPMKASPKELMNDFRGLRFTLDVSGQPAAAISIDTASSAAANRIKTIVSQLTAGAPGLPLKYNVDGDTLRFDFEEPLLGMMLQSSLNRIVAEPTNLLRQCGVAMMEYEQKYKKLPPRETRTKEGKSLLSWRVHVLPYMGQQALYDQFHLDEPWDSPHNAALIPKMPSSYALDDEDARTGKTRFQLPMMEGATFYGDGPQRDIAAVTDGAANTILLMQAPKEKAVTWTKPEEFQLDAGKLKDSLFGSSDATNALFMDCAVKRLDRTMSPELLKAMITMAGNDYALQAKQ